MRMFKAPAPLPRDGFYKVFLAGSIEMDAAEYWQDALAHELSSYDDDLVLLNPRRDDWDSSWTQRASDPKFSEQVNWELDGIAQADLVVVYFDAKTKSPIELLELGFTVRQKATIVCCPELFCRRGNVEILCQRERVRLVDTFPALVMSLEEALANNGLRR